MPPDIAKIVAFLASDDSGWLTGGVILVEERPAFPPNLTTVCGGPNTGHPAIYSTEDIYQVISEGRPTRKTGDDPRRATTSS